MFFLRIRQFFVTSFYKMDKEDLKFVDENLDSYEKNIFYKMGEIEQKHSVLVSRNMLKLTGDNDVINKNRMLKAGLLHDIGKGDVKVNNIEKSVFVLGNYLFPTTLKKSSSKKVFTYYNHGELGYNLLKEHEKDEKLLYLIKNHHANISSSEELDLLKYYDDRN